MALTDEQKRRLAPLLPRIHEEFYTPPNDGLYDLIQDHRSCFLVPGPPQSIEIDLDRQGAILNLVLRPEVPDLQALITNGTCRELTVDDFLRIERLPFTNEERDREAWLTELQDGTLDTITPEDFAYLYDVTDEEVCFLEQAGWLRISTDEHGERYIKAADIIQMDTRMAALRADVEGGQR